MINFLPEYRSRHHANHDPTPRRRFAALGYHLTSRTRCAARYVALTGCGWGEAGRLFGVNAGAVWLAWERIYGEDVPRPVALQPTTSRSRCAVRYRELTGCTWAEAAEAFGLHPATCWNTASEMRRVGSLTKQIEASVKEFERGVVGVMGKMLQDMVPK